MASSASPDGMLELSNQMIASLVRAAAGVAPKGGVDYGVIRAIKVQSSDLHNLLTLQTRMVAALDIRTKYQVASESILFSLARKA